MLARILTVISLLALAHADRPKANEYATSDWELSPTSR